MIGSVCKTPAERKLRRKPSGFSFSIFDSVEYVNRELWDHIAGHEFFMKVNYLQVLEQNPPPSMKFRYAIIYSGSKAVGICYFQLIEFTGKSFGTVLNPDGAGQKKGMSKMLKNFFKKNADKASVRLLISGNAFSSGQHGFVFTNEVDAKDAFRALADVIYRISRADKLFGKVNAVLVKDFFPGMRKYAAELKHYKYYEFRVEPVMVLELKPAWKKFDDYLEAMVSKYRKRARTIIEKGAALEVRSLNAEEIYANGERIMELFDNVHYKAKFRLAPLTIGYFTEMKRTFGDRFMLHAYFTDGLMVGFRSAFITDDATDAHFVGLDYAVNRKYDVYLNMLYDYVKETFERSKALLLLGRTACEIKSTIGARPVELFCYARHRNPLSNRFVKPIISQVRPSEWIQRNPFREK